MKIGPGPELEVGSSLVEDRRAGHVGGHQVGRELDAREADARDLRERARDQRLREAREVLDQDVAVGEHPEQDELERLALADDRPLDLVEDPARAALAPASSTLASTSSLSDSQASLDRRARRALDGVDRSGVNRSSGASRSGRTSSHSSSPRAASTSGPPASSLSPRRSASRCSATSRRIGRSRKWKSNAVAAEIVSSRSVRSRSGGRTGSDGLDLERRGERGAGRGREGLARDQHRREDRERADEQDVDVELELVPAGLHRARDEQRDRDQREETPRPSGAPRRSPRRGRRQFRRLHGQGRESRATPQRCSCRRSSGLYSSSARRPTRASIASSFMPASISCSLNFARSKSRVSRWTANALTWSRASTRSTYSCGVSDSARETP